MSDFDARSYQQEWAHKRAPYSPFGGPSDPTNSGHQYRYNLGNSSRILFGTVVDSVPYLHAYRVLFEQNRPPMICTLGLGTGALPFGARELTQLPPGAHVWVICHPQLSYGVILCVEPDPSLDPRSGRSDWIHQASRCGLRIDSMHTQPFTTAMKGGLRNWSAMRPFDGTTAGEWGAITETGLRVFLDSHQAQVAADEATGLFVFYLDQMVRLCGHNLEEFSSGHVREILDDENELTILEGFAVYPYEQLGAFTKDANPFRTHTAEEVQLAPGHYAALEPQDDHQFPFHRDLHVHGYLGQGGKRLVLAPPEAQQNRYGEYVELQAVLDEQVALTGAYTLSSAYGITLAKRGLLPGPKRVQPPQAPAGDTHENYKASGQYGDGDAHRVQAEPTATKPAQRLAGLLDYHTYLWNWQSLHPFHYHRGDWYVPAPDAQPPAYFGHLANGGTVEPPTPRRLKIDERYGEVDYYPNTAYHSLLPDGSVAIGDGYGAEIRMSRGNITITAPGDITFQTGRNVNTLAGWDTVVKARNSVDISATEHDVRIKAEQNLQALAGNNGRGAILLESRAPGVYDYTGNGEEDITGGIHMKVKDGPVVAWANAIYLRTGGGDVKEGAIVLDAAAGQHDISMHGLTLTRFATSAIVDVFMTDTEVKNVNFYAHEGSLLGGFLSVDGSAQFNGFLLVNGWINVASGHIATEFAEAYNYLVPGLGEGAAQLAQGFADLHATKQENIQILGSFFQDLYVDQLYGEEHAGNDAVIAAAGFSFRTTEQYKTQDFELWETRWQQLARLTGASNTVWAERAVKAAAADTYPYPGPDALQDNTYWKQDIRLVDMASGVAVPRDNPLYESPELAAPQSARPQDAYTLLF